MCCVIKDNIIDVFMNYFGLDMDFWFKEVLKSFVIYFYDFVREINLIYDEWCKGIEFLEWVGNILDVEWYEFVFLFDVLGLLLLVDMLYFYL